MPPASAPSHSSSSAALSSSAKGAQYAATLDAARRMDMYSVTCPATTKGTINTGAVGAAATGTAAGAGAGMDWKELLRKFGKHNPAREVVVAAAYADQVIHSLLAKSSPSSEAPSLYAPSHMPPLPAPLAASNLGAAHTALAALDAAIANGSGSTIDKTSAQIVRGVGAYYVGDWMTCVELLGRTDLDLPRQVGGGAGWEGYDLVLRVMGHAMEGYALERLGKEVEASASYSRAGRAYDAACDVITKIGGSVSSAKDDVVLHSTGEAVLFRLCLWSKANTEPHLALPHHRAYVLRAATYHSSASSSSRRFSTLFSDSRLRIVHDQFRQLIHSTSRWSDLAFNNSAHESMLRRTTKLPRAGEVNVPYVRFLDDVAEGWRRSGAGREGAQDVVDIMYNALTHTFQSHRLLRYLSRALVALGRHDEAGKALRLYLDLFDKSKETDPTKINRELKKFHGTNGDQGEKVSSSNAGTLDSAGESDTDTDAQFVDTMVFAVRVFCKYLDDPATGLKLAQRAKEVFEKSEGDTLKGDQRLESRLERALGVALGASTAKEANPDTRPVNQAAALAHLERAHLLDPTSWQTLYHLAFQLAELRQISPALDKARQAVELSNNLSGGAAQNRDAWHLLGLLVAAQKDMKRSLQVLETGMDDDEDEDDDDGRIGGSSSQLSSPAQARMNGRSGAAANGSSDLLTKLDMRLQNLPPPVGSTTANGGAPSSLRNMSTAATQAPLTSSSAAPAATAPASSNDFAPWTYDYFRDETEQLVADVQLRMSRNVVIEVLEGPESALLDQQALLAYFSSAYAKVKDVAPVLNDSAQSDSVAEPTSSVSKKAPSMLSRPRSIKLSTADAAERLRRNSVGSRSRRSLALEQAESAVEFVPGTPDSGDGVRRMPTVESNPRATKLLVDLWLMSAASYRRAGRLEDAKGAIAEAERLNGDDPDVWVQLAMYHLVKSDVAAARTSLHKALSFSLDHSSALVILSKLYLHDCKTTDPVSLSKQLPFAEGILETLTKRQGWDSPEAWFELSRCFQLKGDVGGRRKEREKECLVWALQLEETRSVRRWEVVPRVL